jgi:hypothetical protein
MTVLVLLAVTVDVKVVAKQVMKSTWNGVNGWLEWKEVGSKSRRFMDGNLD